MVRIEKSVEIRATPEKVWEIIALDRWPEWMDVAELLSAKYTTEVSTPEDKYKVGASAHIVEKRWEYELEITDSVKNDKIAVHAKGKYTYDMRFVLKPVESGTLLTVSGDYVLAGILERALYRLAGGLAERQMEKALMKLKGIAEK